MFVYGSNQYMKVIFDSHTPYLCYKDMVGRWLRVVDIRISRYAKMDADLLSVCIGAGIEIPKSAKVVVLSTKCNYDVLGIKIDIANNMGKAWLVVKYHNEWIPVHPNFIYGMSLKA